MIYLKRADQIEKIALAGKVSKNIMLKALSFIRAGVSGNDIDLLVENELKINDCKPWFREVGGYKFSSCVSVNEGWIHGLPNSRKFEDGDIVSVDIGVKKDGFYVDHCWTVPVHTDSVKYFDLPAEFSIKNKAVEKFLNTGTQALAKSIQAIEVGKRTGRISSAMYHEVRKNGYDVVKEYAGHGVGISSHEDPLIPCFGSENEGTIIKNGMVLAVEVMYSMGDSRIIVGEDGWTVKTADKSITGMFEHTVAVQNASITVLTN